MAGDIISYIHFSFPSFFPNPSLFNDTLNLKECQASWRCKSVKSDLLCNIREIAASPAGEGVEKYIHPFLSFFFVAVGVIFAFYRASTREVGAASPLDKNDTEEADWEEEWPSSFEIARKLWDEDVELSGLRFEFDWDGEITRVHYRHKLDNGEEVLIDGKADSMLYVPEEMQNILNSGENPKLRKGRIVKV
ncbi:MAG: hypothetical protein KKB76_04925, partial [Candidatus Omnitrophica bacterium]|nr:hypothetical protein [Candidatus Omnitrophota bacterium]